MPPRRRERIEDLSPDDPVLPLAEIFPGKDIAFLRAILRGKGGDVALAAEALTDKSSKSGGTTTTTNNNFSPGDYGGYVGGVVGGGKGPVPVIPAHSRLGLDDTTARAAQKAIYDHATAHNPNHSYYQYQQQRNRPNRAVNDAVNIMGEDHFPSLAVSASSSSSSSSSPSSSKGKGKGKKGNPHGGNMDNSARQGWSGPALTTAAVTPPPASGDTSVYGHPSSNSNTSDNHQSFRETTATWGDVNNAPSITFTSEMIGPSGNDNNNEFPDLATAAKSKGNRKPKGGSSNNNGGRNNSNVTPPMSIADKLRLERLCEDMFWVPRAQAQAAFVAFAMNSEATTKALSMAFPSPSEAEIRAHRARVETEKANAAAAQRTMAVKNQGVSSIKADLARGASYLDTPWVATGRDVLDMYARLRSDARDAARVRNQCFMQATEAYKGGNTAKAAMLSKQGREAGERMKNLHREASDAIFNARNSLESLQDPSTIPIVDLHGLHIAEVTEHVLPYYLEKISVEGKCERIRVVTGTGHHSATSASKDSPGRLEAAVIEWLEAYGYEYVVLHDKNGRGGQMIVNVHLAN